MFSYTKWGFFCLLLIFECFLIKSCCFLICLEFWWFFWEKVGLFVFLLSFNCFLCFHRFWSIINHFRGFLSNWRWSGSFGSVWCHFEDFWNIFIVMDVSHLRVNYFFTFSFCVEIGFVQACMLVIVSSRKSDGTRQCLERVVVNMKYNHKYALAVANSFFGCFTVRLARAHHS